MLHLEVLLVTQTRWAIVICNRFHVCSVRECQHHWVTLWIESTEVWYDSSVLWMSPLFLMSTHFFICSQNISIPPRPQHTHIYLHTHTTPTPEALWGSNDTVICYKNLTSSRSKVTWLHLPRSLRCCGVARRVLPLKRSPSSPTAMIASILSWDEIKVLGARDINLL